MNYADYLIKSGQIDWNNPEHQAYLQLLGSLIMEENSPPKPMSGKMFFNKDEDRGYIRWGDEWKLIDDFIIEILKPLPRSEAQIVYMRIAHELLIGD